MTMPARLLAGAACLLLISPALAREADVARAMRIAANAWLDVLDETQRAQATFPFDAEERFNWHFIPRERKGVPLKAMTPAQRDVAMKLLRSGMGAGGLQKAENVRGLEPVLFELENGRPDRDAERYFFSIFGTPSEDKPWGWRYEGHHLSQNWTIVGGVAVSGSPQFFGANPAHVKAGPKSGTRVLAAEEDLARKFLASLDAALKSETIVSGEAPKDIISFNQRETGALESNGVAWTKLNEAQRAALMQLIEEYAKSQAPGIAADRMRRVREAGLDPIRFAWMGTTEPGGPHYYRVQGPTFLIEYDNTQNNANHIHSVWRDFKGDFGRDLLADHYRQHHHAP